MATIGSVSSNRSALLAPSGGNRPDPLSGFAEAIGGLSSAFAERAAVAAETEETLTTRDLRLQDRQQNLEKARTLVDFSRLQGEWTREAAEIEQQAAADGSDLEPRLREGLDKKLSGFEARLPKHLQNTFKPQLETYKQNEYNSAFSKRLGMEGKAYLGGLQELQTQMMDEVFNGTRDPASWEPVLQEYLKNSPLPQAETQVLEKAVRKQLQELDFTLNAKAELAQPGAFGSAANGQPGGMPTVAARLGNAIAGVESGGDYGIMYSPNGKRTFSDFSKHPNQPITITSGPNAGDKSSAAGKYQYIFDTWKYVAGKIGATDFSPVNQEKGMWFLAQDDYGKRTGRNLQSDLESNDPLVLSMVRKQLAGTWEGLKHMTDEEFIAKMRDESVTGTPPSVMNDPSYTELSDIEKFDLMQQAQTQAAAEQAAGFKARQDQNNAMIQQLFLEIQQGKISGQQLSEISLENGFTYEQTQKLEKAREEHQSGVVAVEGLSKSLNTPGHVFGADDQKGLDALYAQEGRAAVNNLDPAYISEAVFPLMERTGMISQQLATDLAHMKMSHNPNQAKYALDTMSGIYALNPSLFARAFDTETVGEVLFYNNTAGYLSEEDRLAEMRRRSSPEFKQVQAQLRQQVQQEFSQNPSDFQPGTIASTLGFEGLLDSRTASAVSQEFNTLYEREYLRYGNHDQAKLAAEQLLKTQWGVTNIGGTDYLMKNAPQNTSITPIAGGFEWLDVVVQQDLPELAGKPYRLASDAQTAAERNKQGGPSYMIETEIMPGVFAPMLDENNLPKRVGFGDAQMQKELSMDVALWDRKERSITGVLDQSAAYGLSGTNENAKKLAAFMQGARRRLESAKPSILKNKEPKRYSGIADLSVEEEQAMLDSFGYPTMDEFLLDAPLFDYKTLLEMME